MTLLCGIHVPMNLWWWASDPKQFFVFLLGGIGVLLIAVAVIWAIVSAVRSNRSKNGGDADSDDPFDAPYSSDTTTFSTDSDKSPLSNDRENQLNNPDVSRTNEIEADIANKYVATMA